MSTWYIVRASGWGHGYIDKIIGPGGKVRYIYDQAELAAAKGLRKARNVASQVYDRARPIAEKAYGRARDMASQTYSKIRNNPRVASGLDKLRTRFDSEYRSKKEKRAASDRDLRNAQALAKYNRNQAKQNADEWRRKDASNRFNAHVEDRRQQAAKDRFKSHLAAKRSQEAKEAELEKRKASREAGERDRARGHALKERRAESSAMSASKRTNKIFKENQTKTSMGNKNRRYTDLDTDKRHSSAKRRWDAAVAKANKDRADEADRKVRANKLRISKAAHRLRNSDIYKETVKKNKEAAEAEKNRKMFEAVVAKNRRRNKYEETLRKRRELNNYRNEATRRERRLK